MSPMKTKSKTNGLKVALLYTGAPAAGKYPEDSVGRDDGDPQDDPLGPITRALEKRGCKVKLVDMSIGKFEKLRGLKADIAFNLCDCGLDNDSSKEPHIPAMLELLGINYTGSDPLTLATCLDKARTKEILAFHGLPTPKFYVAGGVDATGHDLKYPLIVKPLREDGSIGIKSDAVAGNAAELKKLISRIIKLYKQPAIVEEFIDGREFTVSLIGNEDPKVLPICEVRFAGPQHGYMIASYDAKWARDSAKYRGTRWICPADVDAKLQKQIADLAKRAYLAMRVRGYGRVDIRLDKGEPKILEVNPNPDLSLDAQTYRSAIAAGMAYEQLIIKILNYALQKKA